MMLTAIIYNLINGIAFNFVLPLWAVILKLKGLM
nr:MAG TPA: hypothetical protein [Caudoviricetes sp.]